MKFPQLICKIVLINSIFYQSCTAKLSFESVTSYLFGKQHEKIVQKKIDIDQHGTITIKNIHGNITIKEWDHNCIQLQAQKLTPKKEQLDNIVVKAHRTGTHVTIQTIQKKDGNKQQVNYELIVPQTATINAQTTQGSITAHRICAPVTATTQAGNISISQTRGPIVASTQSGNITIDHATGPIQATTAHGNIDIQESTQTVVAKTETGAICTSCKTVPTLDTIALSTNSGNIELVLPNKVNADLQAHTARGNVQCEHYITIKPQTVKLNKRTWSRLKKEVDGTLGTGESTIKLSAGKGNIKITKTA